MTQTLTRSSCNSCASLALRSASAFMKSDKDSASKAAGVHFFLVRCFLAANDSISINQSADGKKKHTCRLQGRCTICIARPAGRSRRRCLPFLIPANSSATRAYTATNNSRAYLSGGNTSRSRTAGCIGRDDASAVGFAVGSSVKNA